MGKRPFNMALMSKKNIIMFMYFQLFYSIIKITIDQVSEKHITISITLLCYSRSILFLQQFNQELYVNLFVL